METTVKEDVWTDIIDRNHHLILVVLGITSLILMCIYFSGSKPQRPSYYFYQDLNSVEIIGPGANDPEVIAAVHHWQKYPFGISPIMYGIESILTILSKIVCLFFICCFLFLFSVAK